MQKKEKNDQSITDTTYAVFKRDTQTLNPGSWLCTVLHWLNRHEGFMYLCLIELEGFYGLGVCQLCSVLHIYILIGCSLNQNPKNLWQNHCTSNTAIKRTLNYNIQVVHTQFYHSWPVMSLISAPVLSVSLPWILGSLLALGTLKSAQRRPILWSRNYDLHCT